MKNAGRKAKEKRYLPNRVLKASESTIPFGEFGQVCCFNPLFSLGTTTADSTPHTSMEQAGSAEADLMSWENCQICRPRRIPQKNPANSFLSLIIGFTSPVSALTLLLWMSLTIHAHLPAPWCSVTTTSLHLTTTASEILPGLWTPQICPPCTGKFTQKDIKSIGEMVTCFALFCFLQSNVTAQYSQYSVQQAGYVPRLHI